MLIGISGRKFSGKSTLALALQQRMPGLRISGFADALKLVCARLYPNTPASAWHGSEYAKGGPRESLNGRTSRELMQRLGCLAREYDPLVWVRIALASREPGADYCFDDVRFPQEVQSIQARGGVVIRLTRNPRPDPHESETALDGYDGFDFVVPDQGNAESVADHVYQWLASHIGGAECSV